MRVPRCAQRQATWACKGPCALSWHPDFSKLFVGQWEHFFTTFRRAPNVSLLSRFFSLRCLCQLLIICTTYLISKYKVADTHDCESVQKNMQSSSLQKRWRSDSTTRRASTFWRRAAGHPVVQSAGVHSRKPRERALWLRVHQNCLTWGMQPP